MASVTEERQTAPVDVKRIAEAMESLEYAARAANGYAASVYQLAEPGSLIGDLARAVRRLAEATQTAAAEVRAAAEGVPS